MGIEDLIQTKSFNLEVCTVIEGLVNFFDRSPRTVQHMLLDSIQCSFLKIIVNAFSERRFCLPVAYCVYKTRVPVRNPKI